MQNTEEKLSDYLRIFSELKSEFKWKVSDQRILMMAASVYTVSGRPFQLESYRNMCDYMKQYSSMFSPFKSYHRFLTGAILDSRYDDSYAAFDELHNVYSGLTDHGFKKGIFTYVAGLAMMGNSLDGPFTKEKMEKAYILFTMMKKNHFFLTSASDYPLAALLAERAEPAEELIARMEACYDELVDKGFKKGNDLQFLSHILTMGDPQHNVISRCVQTAYELERHGLPVKKRFYPEIGLLSFLKNPDWNSLKKITAALNQEFKWYKEMNFTIAVHLVVSGELQHNELLSTGLYTAMETLMQAQQAAMIAVIASTSDSASDGGGGE
ncbi:DUF4003 family protein [Metabacillus mangrovi]|nr:DUF4003 family protein [Metabacillus mangrovi]